MFAGRQAHGFKQAKRAGLTFRGFADGLPRFRIDDRTSTLTPLALEYLDDLKADPFERPLPRSIPLHLLLTHKALYKAYPELRLLAVQLKPASNAADYLIGPLRPRTGGRLSELTIKIEFSPLDTGARLHSVLLHEVQHRIQDIEGFAKGTNVAWEFRQALSERLGRHSTKSQKLGLVQYRQHVELQRLASDLRDDFGDLLRGHCYISPLMAPSAAAGHLFWRLRDYARARYRQNPGELEARQVQHELTLTGKLPRQHITITERSYKTQRRQSARWVSTNIQP